MKIIYTLILSAMFALLSGCASQPQKPTSQPSAQPVTTQAEASKPLTPEELWAKHQKQLQNLNQWQMEGRIAATHGQEGGNASFVWKQKGESYQIRFFGPFGAGSVYVSGSPNQVSLIDGEGKTHRAQTPEELMRKVAGWQLPISGIRYWMLGIPSPHANINAQLLTQDGQLSQLRQLNWTVDYNRYQEKKSMTIPSKIQMNNQNYKVKIIIKNWVP